MTYDQWKSDDQYYDAFEARLKETGKLTPVLKYLIDRVRSSTKTPGYHVELARLLDDEGLSDDALAEYRLAVVANPADEKTRCDLGYAYNTRKRYDEAIAEYRLALRFAPGYARAHNLLGIALDNKDLVEESIAEYRLAIALDPGYSMARNNLAYGYLRQEKIDEAVAEFLRVLEIDPKNSHSHYGLGTVYQRRGQLADAYREYRTALELDPDMVKASYGLYLLKKEGYRPEEVKVGEFDYLTKLKELKDTGILSEAEFEAKKKLVLFGSGTVLERETVREIVKVPCRYCGCLVETTAAKCPGCGAPTSK